jgi:hypothetical protein
MALNKDWIAMACAETHLERPQHHANIWNIPKDGDNNDIDADDSKGNLLGIVHAKVSRCKAPD